VGDHIASHFSLIELAASHLPFVKLASIRIWLRANVSAPWSEAFPMF
jgi:hypothetical protein